MKCGICGNKNTSVVYEGPIRDGGPESEFVDGYKIYGCPGCDIHFLFPTPTGLDDFYESEKYREAYFRTVDEKKLAEKSDWDQNDRVQKIGVENLRGKVVADFGSGLGFFLDCIKGVAKKTIAIEPMKISRSLLERKGHHYFQYPQEVEIDSVDVAVSFDVLEHIENPISFLTCIHNSLKKDSNLYVVIPNRNDILLQAHKEGFQKFFYCTAHLFYYSIGSLVSLLERAGFEISETGGFHKYDFSNFINWLGKNTPTGRKPLDFVDIYFENTFKNELIRLGISSHIFVKATKRL